MSRLDRSQRAEVLTGFDPVSEVQVKAFLNLFRTHALTKEDADLSASLRREHRWKLPDALQAAVAINPPADVGDSQQQGLRPPPATPSSLFPIG